MTKTNETKITDEAIQSIHSENLNSYEGLKDLRADLIYWLIREMKNEIITAAGELGELMEVWLHKHYHLKSRERRFAYSEDLFRRMGVLSRMIDQVLNNEEVGQNFHGANVPGDVEHLHECSKKDDTDGYIRISAFVVQRAINYKEPVFCEYIEFVTEKMMQTIKEDRGLLFNKIVALADIRDTFKEAKQRMLKMARDYTIQEMRALRGNS